MNPEDGSTPQLTGWALILSSRKDNNPRSSLQSTGDRRTDRHCLLFTRVRGIMERVHIDGTPAGVPSLRCSPMPDMNGPEMRADRHTSFC